MKGCLQILAPVAFLSIWASNRCLHAQSQTDTVLVPKYKIDGDFADWKKYETGWAETGLDWSNVNTAPHFDGIDLKGFYYDNDATYLYIFFKCVPTVQQRYEKKSGTGALGYLYIDCDMNTNSGASNKTSEGESAVPGAEIRVYLPLGIYSSYSVPEGAKSGYSVSYEMARWDAASGLFKQIIRKEQFRSGEPNAASLIAAGKDGVEIAILLSDLGMKTGDKFTFACWEEIAPMDFVNRTTIYLK